MNKRWISRAVITWLALSACVVLVALNKYRIDYQSHLASLSEKTELQLKFVDQEIASFERQVISMLQLLSRSYSLFDYVSYPNEIDKRQIQEVWVSLLDYHQAYKQIRFIDINGKEKIKVVPFSGLTKSSELLFDVSNSDYFNYAQSLKYRDIGSSDVRFVTYGDKALPVQHLIYPYDVNGSRAGYIVVDLNFWNSESLSELGIPFSSQPQVVTDSGNYILYPKPEVQFNDQMPANKNNVITSHPELWQQIKKTSSGNFSMDGNFYVYHTFSLEKLGTWHTFVEFSESHLDNLISDNYSMITNQTVLVIIMLIAIVFPSCYLLETLQKQSLDSKLAIAALNGMSAVLICDKKFLMRKVNHEFENITGYKESQIKYGSVKKLFFDRRESAKWFSIWESVSTDLFWEGELNIKGCSGIELTTITRIQAVSNGSSSVENYIISIVDISERKKLEEQLRYLSERDGLTALWNRRKFEMELRNQTLLCGRYPQNHIGCLALVDIDHFKKINDKKGHDRGDLAIKSVASVLVNCTRQTDFVARIGGEEFAIIMPHTNPDEAHTVLERTRMEIEQDESVGTTISIGYTELNSDSTQSYKCADVALYESKSLGRNKTSRFYRTNNCASA